MTALLPPTAHGHAPAHATNKVSSPSSVTVLGLRDRHGVATSNGAVIWSVLILLLNIKLNKMNADTGIVNKLVRFGLWF